jgi:hypothetical protein
MGWRSQDAYIILLEKSIGKHPLGRPRRWVLGRWVRRLGGEWMEVAQVRGQLKILETERTEEGRRLK